MVIFHSFLYVYQRVSPVPFDHLILEPRGPEMDRNGPIRVGSVHGWITGYWPGGHGGSRRLGFHRNQHFCSWIFLPQKMILDDSRWIAIDQASFQTNPARFRSMFQPKPTPVQGVEKDTNDECLMLHWRVEVCSPAVWQAQAWGTLKRGISVHKIGPTIQTINPQSFRYTVIQSLEPNFRHVGMSNTWRRLAVSNPWCSK